MENERVILIGCGKMGKAYAEVLNALNVSYEVVGNSPGGAQAFEKETGKQAISGGWQRWLKTKPASPVVAIVAVPVPELADCACALMKSGIKRILLEKPGGIAPNAIYRVAQLADKYKADVHVAYNRRFYRATNAARQIIAQDGGVLSFHFEFTEIPARVLSTVMDSQALKNWYLINSCHVIDLAYYLCGYPVRQYGIVKSGLDWHPVGSRFAGHGETSSGALFSYHANWESPGSWRLEIATQAHKLVFRPMEKLSIQEKGMFAEVPVSIDYAVDEQFKPGIYDQVDAFLNQAPELDILPTIQTHADRLNHLLAPLHPVGKV